MINWSIRTKKNRTCTLQRMINNLQSCKFGVDSLKFMVEMTVFLVYPFIDHFLVAVLFFSMYDPKIIHKT